MANRVVLNETSYFGRGARENVVTEINARGFKNILVVTDHNLVQNNVAGLVTNLLDKANINYITSDIINLKYKLNGKFDYINLSNILERINNNKKEVSKKILQDLYKYLKKNGCISCYNFKISVNDIPLEILDIYETEFDTYVGLYLNKDVVALYKKKQKK